MPEADGLEYPGRKDLIGLARGLYRFLRTVGPFREWFTALAGVMRDGLGVLL